MRIHCPTPGPSRMDGNWLAFEAGGADSVSASAGELRMYGNALLGLAIVALLVVIGWVWMGQRRRWRIL